MKYVLTILFETKNEADRYAQVEAALNQIPGLLDHTVEESDEPEE